MTGLEVAPELSVDSQQMLQIIEVRCCCSRLNSVTMRFQLINCLDKILSYIAILNHFFCMTMCAGFSFLVAQVKY